jgi:DNA-binding LacI/PurR family transcriptional regulator
MSNQSRPQGRATLQEVAEKAGVSATTASLVLAGKAGRRRISEEAHIRVRKAAEELNYAPNLLVRSLRRGRTHIISFYNSFRQRPSQDLYLDKLAASVEYAGGAFGYDILVHCNFDRSVNETYQFLNGGLSDGLLVFAPVEGDPLVEQLRRSNLPVVLLNTRDPKGQFPSVADDGEMGMKIVAETLVDLGHRRIAAFKREGPHIRDAGRRVRLLRKYLADLGVQVDEELVVEFEAGQVETLKRLMDHPKPPTAIFCWHDHTAYFALEACAELGISVPDQLSIVGYDGIRWPSATAHVAASVKVDLELLARRGIRLLDLVIQGYEGPLIEEVLPVAFSPGTTLGPVRRL